MKKTKPEDIRNPLHYFRRMMKNETYREREKANARNKIETSLDTQEFDLPGTEMDELEDAWVQCAARGDLQWIELIENKSLFDAIKALPIGDQKVLTYYVKDGLFQSEIAQIVGCSQQNIADRLLRIRKQIKKFSESLV